ncbi:hypothetical protein PG995_008903 [Apiospora arundinis]
MTLPMCGASPIWNGGSPSWSGYMKSALGAHDDDEKRVSPPPRLVAKTTTVDSTKGGESQKDGPPGMAS